MDRHRAHRRLVAGALMSAMTLVGAIASGEQRPDVSAPLPAAVTTRELVEVRGLSGLSLSPDGAYAIVRVDHQDVDRNMTVLDWMSVRLGDGHVRRLADGGAPRWTNNGFLAAETPQWSPDGAWVYFKRLDQDEVQLWRISRTDGREEQLTHDAADVAAFIVDADGSVHYATGPATRNAIRAAEDAEIDSGVLFDSSIIKGFPLAHGFPVNGRMATLRAMPALSASGRSTLLGAEPLRMHTLEPGTGAVRDANATIARRFAELWGASYGGQLAFDPGGERRGRAQAVARSASLETRDASTTGPGGASRSGQVLVVRGEEGRVATCDDPRCLDADSLDIAGWTAGGDELVFRIRSFEAVSMLAWDIAANRVREIRTTDGVLGSDASGTSGQCRIADHEAICIAAAADQPPRVVAIDLGSGAERVLLDPNPGLTPARLGVASRIVLKDRFGNVTIGRLILPAFHKPGERLPLVITSYTCRGFLLGGTGRDAPEHVLAGLGYAAVCVDLDHDAVRHAPDFQMTQDNGYLSFLDFFKAAVSVLDAAGIADPERVALNGFSGSATATAFAISQSDMFTTAAVTTEGSLDPIVCYLTAHMRSCEKQARAQGLLAPYDSPTGVMRNSPALHVEKIRTPLLMQLPEVEYVSMLQLYSAMTDYDRAVEMYVFPNAYHYKNQPRQRLAVYDRNVAWVGFWLRGEAPDGLDQEGERNRWRQLREAQCRLFPSASAGREPWYCAGGK